MIYLAETLGYRVAEVRLKFVVQAQLRSYGENFVKSHSSKKRATRTIA